MSGLKSKIFLCRLDIRFRTPPICGSGSTGGLVHIIPKDDRQTAKTDCVSLAFFSISGHDGLQPAWLATTSKIRSLFSDFGQHAGTGSSGIRSRSTHAACWRLLLEPCRIGCLPPSPGRPLTMSGLGVGTCHRTRERRPLPSWVVRIVDTLATWRA
jgi:hypothetical protein